MPGRSLVKLLPDYGRPRVYALDRASLTNNGTLLALNPTNGAIISEIAVGINPTDMVMAPAGDALYVIHAGSRAIAKVGLSTFTVLSQRDIATPNLSTPLYLAAGRSNLVYFTDGGWAPAVITFDYEAGTNVSVYDDGNGTGGLFVTRDGTTLYTWRQYGWGGGNVNSWVRRQDARLVTLPVLDTSFVSFRRDPLDTPILVDDAETRVFNKQQVFSATNVSVLLSEFSENIYAVTRDGSVASGSTRLFRSDSGLVLTNLGFSSSVQTVSGDQQSLFRYRPSPSELRVYSMAGLLGQGWETNQPPIASFRCTPTNTTTLTAITFDAGASTDDQGGGTNLLYRWDWENDGVFDTGFTNVPVVTHRFYFAGTKTVRLQIRDRFGSTHAATRTFDVVYQDDSGQPVGATPVFEVQFAAADVAFDPVRPVAYVSGYSNKVLAVVNLTNGLIERQFSFAFYPGALCLAPDGQALYVALAGSGTNSAAVFDLPTMTKTREFGLAGVPYDLAATDTGILLVSDQAGGSTLSYRISTGQLLGAMSTYLQKYELSLHPGQRAIYFADTITSPSDIRRCEFDPDTGLFGAQWDSPYSDDYPMGGNVWCHPNGSNIIVGGGGVFTSASVQAADMRYFRSLSGGAVETLAFDTPRMAFFTVGNGLLQYYNQNSFEGVRSQTVSNWVQYVHATATNMFVGGVASGRTYFQCLVNPAAGAESNRPPVAAFLRSPSDASTVTAITFDAAASTDDQGGGTALQYRWDWENDGGFDTPFSNVSTAAHRYHRAGRVTAALQVMDRFGEVCTVTQTFDIEQQDDPGVPGEGNTAFELPFVAADVAFDPVRPYAYVSGYANKTLAVLNLTNGLVERLFSFDWMPESIAISPDARKMYVALLRRDHSSYWFGGHTNFIAEFDLQRQVLTREFQVLADPFDLAVTDGGILFVTGGSDQSSDIRSYSVSSGQLLSVSSIYERARIALHPGQRAVYTTYGESYPTDIRRHDFDPASGLFTTMWDSIYSGEQPMAGNVWCHPNGTNLIVRGGRVFTSSTVEENDMRYVRSLEGPVEGLAFDSSRSAFFTVGNGQISYPYGDRRLRHYHSDSFEMAGSQTISNWVKYVHAAGASVYLAGDANGRTYFQRMDNPAVGVETNQTPVASFARSPEHPTTLTTIAFDARSSADDQGGGTNLLYRWDWENDGAYDTPFTNQPVAGHRFQFMGTKIVALQVKDRHGAVHSVSRTFDVRFESDPTLPGGGDPAFQVPFAAADVAFDPVRPYAYVSGYSNRALIMLNLDSGMIEHQFNFDWSAEAVTISPDGQKMYVALPTRPHDMSWAWDKHVAYIAEFDLNQRVKTREFRIDEDPFDMVVTDGGVLILTGGSSQWTFVRTYRASTGELLARTGEVYQDCRLSLHPNQRSVYIGNRVSTDHKVIDPVTGQFVSAWSRSGTLGGAVWCFPQNHDLLLRGDRILTTSEVPASDMLDVRLLSGGAVEDVSFDVANGAFLAVGNGQLHHYRLDSLDLTSSRPVSGGTRHIHASGPLVHLARIENGRTLFTRLGNPAFATPQIVRQPAPQTVPYGGSGTMVVESSGAPPLNYLWLKDGAPFTNNRGTLTFTNVTQADAGGYSVVISNAHGSVTSVVATLSVLEPLISTHPAGLSRDAGSSATFAVVALGTQPLAYQWLRNGVPLTNGGRFNGVTAPTLNIGGLLGADAGGYSLVVTNAFGSVTSVVANLIVIDPLIVQQPSSKIGQTGQGVSFAVGVVGTAPLLYQWFKDNVALTNGGRISGANNATLVLTSLTVSDAGAYRVVVSNTHGSATSSVATLSINAVTLDAAFSPNANTTVSTMAFQPDGRLVIGGSFLSVGGQARNRIARLNSSGSLDIAFNPNVTGSQVLALALQEDGKIIVGGSFATIGGITRNYFARLNTNGTVDTTFNLPANEVVRSLAMQPDGKIIVGGTFTTLGGQPRARLARVNANGTLDAGFTTGANGDVYAVAVQPDGKILLGGNFVAIGNQPRQFIGRLNSDGSVDDSFAPGAGGTVLSIVVQPDGRILVGGAFSSIASAPRSYLARLLPNGALDSSFIPAPNNTVNALALQADEKIVVAGQFFFIGGLPRIYLARLDAGGAADSTFNPAPSSPVSTLALQADGKILASGGFTNIAGQTRSGFVRLNATVPAIQELFCQSNSVVWRRGGTCPEAWRTQFEHSLNGITWTYLGVGTYVDSFGWTLANVSLPAAGRLRARAYTAGGQFNGFSGIIETTLIAPVINVPPVSRVVIPEDDTHFSLYAAGTPPLSYQWLFNGTPLTNGAHISGVTNAILTVNDVIPGLEGSYSVVVSNAYGAITSSVVSLRITPRAIHIAGTNATPGATITLPVHLVSDNGENAFEFSVAYDTNVLNFISATNGADAGDASFMLDASQAAAGRIGISLARPAGVGFTSGLHELALLAFNVASVSNAAATPLTFADAPVARLVSGTNGIALPTLYAPGGVSVLASNTIGPSGSSSLFTQVIRVTNPGNAGGTVRGVRVWFHDLGLDSKGYPIRVYNAAGTSNGVPFIACNASLAPGQSVNLTVEYYIADRRTAPHPRIVVEFPGLQAFEVPAGTVLSATFQLVNGNGVVEFNTLAGQTYYVQYAGDADGTGGWETALPAITGTGGVVQWIDSGPPKTESAPSEAPSRFYRVLLVTP